MDSEKDLIDNSRNGEVASMSELVCPCKSDSSSEKTCHCTIDCALDKRCHCKIRVILAKDGKCISGTSPFKKNHDNSNVNSELRNKAVTNLLADQSYHGNMNSSGEPKLHGNMVISSDQGYHGNKTSMVENNSNLNSVSESSFRVNNINNPLEPSYHSNTNFALESLRLDLKSEKPSSNTQNSQVLQGIQAQKKKTPSFQITSVTVVQSGEPTAGDESPDETEETSEIADSSKVFSDMEQETPSNSEDCAKADDALHSLPVVPTSTQYGITAVVQQNESGGLLTSRLPQGITVNVTTGGIALAEADGITTDAENLTNRFKIVKIASNKPFKKGRWVCFDFVDSGVKNLESSEGIAIPLAVSQQNVNNGQNSIGLISQPVQVLHMLQPHSSQPQITTTQQSNQRTQFVTMPSHSGNDTQTNVALTHQVPNKGYSDSHQALQMQVQNSSSNVSGVPPVHQIQSQGQQSNSVKLPLSTQVLDTQPIPPTAQSSQNQSSPISQGSTTNAHHPSTQSQESMQMQPQVVQSANIQQANQQVPTPSYVQSFPAPTQSNQGLMVQLQQTSVPVTSDQNLSSQSSVLYSQDNYSGPQKQTPTTQPPSISSPAAQTPTTTTIHITTVASTSSSTAVPTSETASNLSNTCISNLINTQFSASKISQLVAAEAAGVLSSIPKDSIKVDQATPPLEGASGVNEEEKTSASSASTVAIDNKIEQAMDLVKSHLMFAVREEVDVLKERIGELMERITHLEYENTILKKYATQEALQQLQISAPNP